MDVLIVRSGALGDTILTMPLLDSIKRAHPGAAATFLGSGSYLPLVHPSICCRPIDSASQTWLFSSRLDSVVHDNFCFDCAYVILHHPQQVAQNLLKQGIPHVRQVIPTPMPGMHLVEHLHNGLELPIPERICSLLHLAPKQKKDLVWVHPGSGSPSKCIPLALYISLSRKVLDETTWDIVVTATEQDAFLMRDPQWKSLVSLPRTHLISGKPLVDLCQEIGGARLFMGNDSGVSHLAAGLGIRSIAFFIASDPAHWAPWAPRNKVTVIDCRFEMPTEPTLLHVTTELLSTER